jgi:restriction system protein
MFENLVESITEIDSKRDYWFVRTDSGIYFETYVENGFIAIGWNEITVQDLEIKTPIEVKAKIAKAKNIDTTLARGKSQASSIYNKLKRFQGLKEGDLVIIPSSNSSRFAFGIIQDNNIYSDSEGKLHCDHVKRRKISWIEVENVNDLDPIFYKIKNTRHAISSINSYDKYIDSVTEVIYKKDDYSFYVLDINTQQDINIKPLVSLVDNLQILLESINKEFSLNEDTDESSIKLNLQSPGKIIIKLKKGTSLILVAVVLALSNGCAPKDLPIKISPQELTKLQNIMKVDSIAINSTNRDMKVLEVDLNKVNSFR